MPVIRKSSIRSMAEGRRKFYWPCVQFLSELMDWTFWRGEFGGEVTRGNAVMKTWATSLSAIQFLGLLCLSLISLGSQPPASRRYSSHRYIFFFRHFCSLRNPQVHHAAE